MEWLLVKWFWIPMVLFVFGIHGCLGCVEEEKIALLETKPFVNWEPAGDVDRVKYGFCCAMAPPGVVGYAKDGNCCDWVPGVISCNPTGRVAQLSLGGRINREGNRKINYTIFSAFRELEYFDLSENLLTDWTANEGFERLAGLKKLESLDLRSNSFNSTILSSVGAITSLKTLSLAYNQLGESSSSHFAGLANLRNLQSLDLSYNSIEASSQTMQVFKSFGKLQSLEVLVLDFNGFNNSILQSVGTLKSLKKLSLSFNNLKGSLHFEDLCKLKSLEELDLSNNRLEAILPPCLNNLTALRKLELSNNQFKGNISSSLIFSLTSLAVISLSHNDFDGTFPFISFANNSNLEVIDLHFAGDKLKVDTDYPSWVPPFQLKMLVLSNKILTQNTNAFPGFLRNQYNLKHLDLSNNNLKGTFPIWLLENNNYLEFLNLKNNSLSGQLVPPSCSNWLAVIDISNNALGGLLQPNIGQMFPNAMYLNLSQNFFEGHIPSSIASMQFLFYLDLSSNNFSGEIPLEMANACNELQVLRLSNNRLHGQMLPPNSNWTKLISLRLNNNSFSGDILTGLSTCFRLQVLDIGNNQITGRIPNWIGNFTDLSVLILEGNFLQGNIPVEFCNLQQIYFLDLSNNFLSGSIPSILNSTSLQYLHLQRNRFIGTLPPPSSFNHSSLLTFDIKDNEFNGIIPNWIGSLFNLRVLLLKQNHFIGPIPNCFCQLALVNIMDLSHNALSGSIPRCLNNISFGRKIDTNLTFVKIVNSFAISPRFYDDANLLFSKYDTEELGKSEEVDFVTKSISYSYKGDVLNFVSGLDLFCNNLSNVIPFELGDLNSIFALNLSHNQLAGPIPRTISNLSQIESLDLSYNKLNGEIPSDISILYSLAVFTVAHNNLSGKTPEMTAQFGTFTSTSYEGNPFLCGPPLPRNCSSGSKGSTNTSARTPSSIADNNEDDGIDMGAFIASFAGSYLIFLLGIAAVLCINPYWRRMWFHFIDQCINSTCEFVSDTWYKLVTRACT